jgi:hypothetical protein
MWMPALLNQIANCFRPIRNNCWTLTAFYNIFKVRRSVIAFERLGETENLPKHNPKGINIRADRRRSSAEHFRGRVRERFDVIRLCNTCGVLGPSILPGLTKIAEFYPSITTVEAHFIGSNIKNQKPVVKVNQRHGYI